MRNFCGKNCVDLLKFDLNIRMNKLSLSNTVLDKVQDFFIDEVYIPIDRGVRQAIKINV